MGSCNENKDLDGVSTSSDKALVTFDIDKILAELKSHSPVVATMLHATSGRTGHKSKEDIMKVKMVFEQETRSMMSSTWKPHNMVLCSNPAVVAPELFVPSQQQAVSNSTWQVDFNIPDLDADGWTYSTSFANLNKTGTGDMKPVWWKSAVRRRKWQHQEVGVCGNEVLKDVKEGQEVNLKTSGFGKETKSNSNDVDGDVKVEKKI